MKIPEEKLFKQSLEDAYHRGEFTLHYQPQIKLPSHSLSGFEVLLRWHSAQYGNVSPERFIPLLETSGSIDKVGKWIITKACTFAQALIEAGGNHLCVWVNVSPHQLVNGNIVEHIKRAISDAQIFPWQFGIEITENSPISFTSNSLHNLRRLRNLGIKIALDDFGTGYSSLAYLQKLPIHMLKIDKAFVDSLAFNEKQQNFVHLIIKLAHNFGLKVIAEGVETETQVEWLSYCHCDYIQGYIFSRPIPIDEALRLAVCRKVDITKIS